MTQSPETRQGGSEEARFLRLAVCLEVGAGHQPRSALTPLPPVQLGRAVQAS